MDFDINKMINFGGSDGLGCGILMRCIFFTSIMEVRVGAYKLYFDEF